MLERDEDYSDLGITDPELKAKGGAAGRYKVRIASFKADGRRFPRLRHHAMWLLHNCVAHPLLAYVLNEETVGFHDLTSQWLNQASFGVANRGWFRTVWITPPEVKNRRMWVAHNFLAHVAIGLVPCEATFDFHDWTAEQMNVPGWV